jgi:hypothetical protein
MSIRKHPVAYLALFIALGGTSYAATQLPANSVGTDQLAFPLGMASVNAPTKRVPVSCTSGRRCVRATAPLARVRFSLKKSSQLLVLFQARAVEHGTPAPTTPLFLQPTPVGRRMPYQVTDSPTRISYSAVISRPAGPQTVGLDGYASAYGTTRPPRSFVRVYNPQLTVIALPPLR